MTTVGEIIDLTTAVLTVNDACVVFLDGFFVGPYKWFAELIP